MGTANKKELKNYPDKVQKNKFKAALLNIIPGMDDETKKTILENMTIEDIKLMEEGSVVGPESPMKKIKQIAHRWNLSRLDFVVQFL